MPSQFEQTFAASSLSNMYASFGLVCLYTSPDGAEVSIGLDGSPLLARVQRGDFHQVERASRANGEAQTGVVLIRKSQIAKVVKNGRFLVESVEIWTVTDTPRLQNGEFICTCVRSGVERLMDRRAKE